MPKGDKAERSDANQSDAKCFCGSQRLYKRCCEPYLTGVKAAPTAEALMRSRYSAFCSGNIDYLVKTHHPDYRSTKENDSLALSVRKTQWLNLIVLSAKKGQRKDSQGTVEFVAAYRDRAATPLGVMATNATNNRIQQMHERSRFKKESGTWFYTDGDMLAPYSPKRSQPCWCGSGRPFKQCHEKR